MPSPKAVVVGASAGGVEALRALVAGLPVDLPAAVMVVLHVPRSAPSALPGILDRSGPLDAVTAVDGEPIVAGRIYVATADHHLLIIDGRIRLSRGPEENGHRPAVDPLFRSAARAYGPRALGVVLSGSRDDGAAGLAAIAARGGTTIVQDPVDALYSSMPRAALEQVAADHVVPAAKIGPLIAELARAESTNHDRSDSGRLDPEVSMAGNASLSTDALPVPPAGYGCPNCGGALFEMHSTPVPRFRCRVGHAWSPDSLLEEQAIAMEGALWMALRALEEKRTLSERMADSGRDRDLVLSELRYRAVAEDASQAVGLIRDLITQVGSAANMEETPQSNESARRLR